MQYDEDAFLYFLDIERARAGRANHPLPMLFATFEPVAGKPVPIPESSAARLVEQMRETLRDTDIVGWYQQGRVAGAVLGVPPNGETVETSAAIEMRVGNGLRRRMPEKIASSLRVRVVQLGPRQLAKTAQD